ncbi:hypothetical protein BDW68DRAFT_161396 [Aspergillus falconensis]
MWMCHEVDGPVFGLRRLSTAEKWIMVHGSEPYETPGWKDYSACWRLRALNSADKSTGTSRSFRNAGRLQVEKASKPKLRTAATQKLDSAATLCPFDSASWLYRSRPMSTEQQRLSSLVSPTREYNCACRKIMTTKSGICIGYGFRLHLSMLSFA